MPLSLSRLLLKPRECASDWLIIQAYELACAGQRYSSHSLLVFSCLETRNAIEQLWFEILTLVHDGEMSEDYFHQCRKRSDGFLAAIGQAEPKYRQLSRFSSLVMEVDSKAPYRGIAWDLGKLKRIWHALSDYCHAHGHPAPTIQSTEWVQKGYGLVEEAYKHFQEQMTGGATALMKPQSMTPSTRIVWESFIEGKLSEAEVKVQLVSTAKPQEST
jgi:hypothetical protein